MQKYAVKQLGDFELSLIEESRFWLDGGSMFGIVPKVLWQKLMPADENNRIELSVNCLLVRGKNKNLLIDTGIGDSLKPRYHEIYRFQKDRGLCEKINAHGVAPSDIDFVINTHLHFDHGGGNVIRENGNIRPTFPNARYIIQKKEWAEATNPNERNRASYMDDDFNVLRRDKKLLLVDGDYQVIPGIKTILTNGHCRGHQSVEIKSKGERAIFLGDIIPTTAHLKATYMTAFENHPMELLQTKKQVIKRAIRDRSLLIFEHDPNTPMVYLEEHEGKLVLKPI